MISCIYALIKLMLSMTTASLLLNVGGFINAQYLAKYDKNDLYILAIFSPIYYVLLSIQESFKSTTIAITSRLDVSQLKYMIKNFVVLALMVGGLFICFFHLTDNWFAFHLHVDAHLTNRFQHFNTDMVWLNIIISINSIFNAIIFSARCAKASFVFQAFTCLMALMLLIVQMQCGNEGLSSLINALGVANIICAILMLKFLQRRIFHPRPGADPFRIDSNRCENNFTSVIQSFSKIGLPIFFSYLVIFSGYAIFNSLLTKFGIDVVSGYGMACRLQAILILPAIGLGSAMAILLKQKYSISGGMLIGFVFYGFIAIVMYYDSSHIVHLFMPTGMIYQTAIQYFHCVASSYFVLGPLIAFTTLLEQIGYGIYVLIINLLYFSSIGLIGKWILLSQPNYTSFFHIISHINFFSFFVVVIFYPILFLRRL